MKKLIIVGFWLSLLSLSQLPLQAQTPSPNFPSLVSHEILPRGIGDWAYSVSNDAEYFYTCNFNIHPWCGIWDRTRQYEVTASEDGLISSWSSDGRRIITPDRQASCDQDGGNLIIFDGSTRSISKQCFTPAPVSIDWSPLDPNIAVIYTGGYYLLDVTTFQATPFTPSTTLTPTDLARYVGYGNYFWNPATGLPGAVLSYKGAQDLVGQTTSSRFEACTFDGDQCVPIFDTLTVSNVAVFNRVINGYWLIWGGHQSLSGESRVETITNPSLRADTILYITDIITGETRELFRYSSLALTDVYVEGMEWSPDRKTIALALEFFDKPLPPLIGEVSVTPYPRAGVVLLRLNWPPRADVETDQPSRKMAAGMVDWSVLWC